MGVILATQVGGTKTNNVDNSGLLLLGLGSVNSGVTVGDNSDTNETGFAVTSFFVEDGIAEISLGWPSNQLFGTDVIDVYWKRDLTNVWNWLGGYAVDTNRTETEIALRLDELLGAVPASSFFCFGTQWDTDGDALPDAYEELISKTHKRMSTCPTPSI